MTKSAHPPAFWIASCAALALAAVAIFNPPERGVVRDLPTHQTPVAGPAPEEL